MSTITCPHCFNELEIEVSEVEVQPPEPNYDLICDWCHEEHPSRTQAKKCCNSWYKRWMKSDTDVPLDTWKKFAKEAKR